MIWGILGLGKVLKFSIFINGYSFHLLTIKMILKGLYFVDILKNTYICNPFY